MSLGGSSRSPGFEQGTSRYVAFLRAYFERTLRDRGRDASHSGSMAHKDLTRSYVGLQQVLSEALGRTAAVEIEEWQITSLSRFRGGLGLSSTSSSPAAMQLCPALPRASDPHQAVSSCLAAGHPRRTLPPPAVRFSFFAVRASSANESLPRPCSRLVMTSRP
jgi:hypothetical protein